MGEVMIPILLYIYINWVTAQSRNFTWRYTVNERLSVDSGPTKNNLVQFNINAMRKSEDKIFQPSYLARMIRLLKYGHEKNTTIDEHQTGKVKSIPPYHRVLLPKYDDHESVLALAMMSRAAYSVFEQKLDEMLSSIPKSKEHSTGSGKTYENSNLERRGQFGWDYPGVRGHVFLNEDESVVVISFKGTSTFLTGGGTVESDRYADNTMFSCCCARVDLLWSPVCDCYRGNNQCSFSCLQEAIKSPRSSHEQMIDMSASGSHKGRQKTNLLDLDKLDNSENPIFEGEEAKTYYEQALGIYKLVRKRHPKASVWLTGHSLGGSLASLVAITDPNKASAVTFSAPGALRYAQVIGLVNDKEDTSNFPIWNYGLSSDPIFTGRCAGPTTSCYLAGYAIETVCRLGYDCMFQMDAIWQPDVSTHRMSFFIKSVLNRPEKYPLPVCEPVRNCVDCSSWKWV